MANSAILATRRGGEVLIAEDPVRVDLAWPTLKSADGDEMSVRWTASVACVDSAADRALLSERFFADEGSSTLAIGRVGIELARAIAASVGQIVEQSSSDELTRGSSQTEFSAKILAAARSAAFAGGLALLPPYEVSIRSPSRERASLIAETEDRLATLAASDDARARSLADVAKAIAESAGDSQRARQILSTLRLSDPLDVLRATAIVEPSWSAATPSLWIAAGSKLGRLDMTTLRLDASEAISIDPSLGPIRSVSATQIDGADFLLVGVRDGVHVVTNDESPRVTKSLRFATDSEFGFNAACFVAGDRTIVATHSKAGIVAWPLEGNVSPFAVAVEGARSVITNSDESNDVAALIVNGGLTVFTREGGVVPFAGNLRLMSMNIGGRDGATVRKLIREDLISAADVRFAKPVGVEDEIEVGGVPRAVRPLATGGLVMMDAAGLTSLPIGPTSLVARSVAARPGFVAAISVDRTRVAIIDLSQPEKVAAEIHVAATLGNRVADIEYA